MGQGEADGEVFLRQPGRHVPGCSRRLPLQVGHPVLTLGHPGLTFCHFPIGTCSEIYMVILKAH